MFSQLNLIQNSGFEKYSNLNCNNVAIDDYSVFPVKHVLNNWETLNSSDYFTSVCSPTNTYRGVPTNDFGYSYPYEGNAYTGFISFIKNGETKEYIYQHLSSPLVQDSIYCLSLFTSRADRVTHSIHSIGAYFSVNTPILFSNYYVNANPQVVNQNSYITDTIGWTEIRGCFIAQGGEQYVTLGNFNSNANTDTIYVGASNPQLGANGYAYYYIDSVTLWKNNFPTAIKEFSNDDGFLLYPNPTEGSLTLALSKGEGIVPKQCVVKINDVLGREVKQLNFEEEINVSDLEQGIYFITIIQSGKTLGVKKIIKQ